MDEIKIIIEEAQKQIRLEMSDTEYYQKKIDACRAKIIVFQRVINELSEKQVRERTT